MREYTRYCLDVFSAFRVRTIEFRGYFIITQDWVPSEDQLNKSHNALPRRYLRGCFFCGGVGQSRGLPRHSVVFAEACLVRVRHNVAYRTIAAALGFGRCRHCNDVCSLVCRTTALDYLRCCRFLHSESKLRIKCCHCCLTELIVT